MDVDVGLIAGEIRARLLGPQHEFHLRNQRLKARQAGGEPARGKSRRTPDTQYLIVTDGDELSTRARYFLQRIRDAVVVPCTRVRQDPGLALAVDER